MSIENLDIVTSIQNYIAELERTANVSGGEAAEYAAGGFPLRAGVSPWGAP